MPPTLCFGTAPDQCFFFLVRPKTANTIDVEIGYLFHPSALEDPLFEHKLALSDAGVQVFVRQDQDATTKVQRGLHSRFAPRGATRGRRRATSASTAGWSSATGTGRRSRRALAEDRATS